jgi:hypothetical protein
LPITSARREVLLTVSVFCSVAIVLAASSERFVQRGVGANRQRHQADQSDGDGNRAARDAELAEIHGVSQSLSNARQSRVHAVQVLGVASWFAVELCSICGNATSKPLTCMAFRGNHLWRMAPCTLTAGNSVRGLLCQNLVGLCDAHHICLSRGFG